MIVSVARLSLLAAGFGLATGPAAAQTSADEGARVFLEACAGCHGADARGNGPTAALLSVPVPDLTLFASRDDGRFDAERMVRIIDGRDGLTAHGGPMPMFGGLLAGPSVLLDASDGSPFTTTEPILGIVLWLESVQREPDP